MARLEIAKLEDGNLNCNEVQEYLEDLAMAGQPLTPQLRQHLQDCPTCLQHWQLLQGLQEVLLEEVPATTPPPQLRGQILAVARTKPTIDTTNQPSSTLSIKRYKRSWWTWVSAAAALGGLLAWTAWLGVAGGGGGLAAALPDPAVVVSTSKGILVASNDQAGTLSLLQGNKVVDSLSASGQQAAWFTQGVRLGQRVFLADAANDRVLEVTISPLKLQKVHAVPNGIAGLTASQTGQIYFKTVRGAVGMLGGKKVNIAREPDKPLTVVMDSVLMAGGNLWVTHHLRGEVCLLDAEKLNVKQRLKMGGSPVDLAHYRGGVLVLDAKGKLLHFGLRGEQLAVWPLLGQPDKLALNGQTVLVSDRSGQVTSLQLVSGQLKPLRVRHPMDVIALPDGNFALAEGGKGVRVLTSQLTTAQAVEH